MILKTGKIPICKYVCKLTDPHRSKELNLLFGVLNNLFMVPLPWFSADNLGSLALGGFKESCTAIRMCRHCMTTKDDPQKQVN